MARVDREQRQATVARLTQLRADDELTAEHVRLAASGLGVTERTVWRWLEPQTGAPARPGPAPYRLSDTDLAAYQHYRGNIAYVHRARSAVLAGHDVVAGVPIPEFLRSGWAGAEPVGLRGLQKAFARELTPAEVAAWSRGEHARRDVDVYLTRPPTPRNRVWELDHKDLPILVLPPRGPAVRPWLTSVVDDGTRGLLGWALALTPHSGTVLTALRMALLPDPVRGPFGGIPARVRVDQGLDFAAEVITDALTALVIDPHRLPGYTPYRKGKVEHIHRTIEQILLCALAGYTDGPRDVAGQLYGPIRDSPAARAAAETTQTGPLRIERFAALFADWVAWYNTERPHSMLEGQTPVQAWQADHSAVRRIEGEQLRHLLLAGVQRTIGKDGVRFHGLAYVAPELQGRGGEAVQVRYMPHDDRSIEVYLGGVHLCTAYPQQRLTPEQTDEFRAHSRAEAKRLGAPRRQAARRARAELVPLNSDQPAAQESRLMPVTAPREPARRRARTDLLGLTDPTAPPEPIDLDQPDQPRREPR